MELKIVKKKGKGGVEIGTAKNPECAKDKGPQKIASEEHLQLLGQLPRLRLEWKPERIKFEHKVM